MGQGQDKIASSLLELQPTAIIELFLLYFNTVDNPNAFIAFHGGSVYNKGIVWQGVEYLPIPVETDGFEVTANGKLSRPKMRISNKDYFATDLLINNDDLQFAKIIRKRTFVKYLDNINFDGGNPWGQADSSAELSSDTFVVGQKTAENKVYIELELTSPLDLENFEVNNRLIMSRYCSWYYRGTGCAYKGIPVATEINEPLTVTDPEEWYTNQSLKKWKTNISYQSGQAAFIENEKITVPGAIANSREFAKIWYVCQSGHTSSISTVPDKNPSIWKRDGCNKKLDGCKLRFGKGVIQFNSTPVTRTANFVDFTSRAGAARYNNIAALATIAETELPGFEKYNLTDLKSGASSIWKASSWVNGESIIFTFPSSRRIGRVDIYDNPSTASADNFVAATVGFFNGPFTPHSTADINIPTNGTRATASPIMALNQETNSIRVTANSSSSKGTLSEVAIFESFPPHLVYNDQEATRLHANDFFQIATWIGLSGRDLYPYECYSVLHNISGGCRHSGINLYLQGQSLQLDFATYKTNPTGAGEILVKQTLGIPWKNDSMKPLHIICSGGLYSTQGGYIELTDGISETNRFVLSRKENEYFKFKANQQGIQAGNYRLEFGINDWQFPVFNEFTPDPEPPTSQIVSNMKLISPIKFGPTAIWTTAFGVDNRIRESSQSVFKDYTDFSSRASNINGLIGWWEMIPNSAGVISAQNNSAKQLIISGVSPSTFTSSQVGSVNVSSIINREKQSVTLPFGGFPGTERYG